MRIATLIAGGLAGAALMAAPVQAQPQGDPGAGKDKAFECLGCHASETYSNIYPTYKVPKVGGQSAQYIVSALKAYASGDRQHPTMTAQAEALNEQDMQDIAAYFAQKGAK
ncbi:c-type cytochrome [Thiohalorhabdus sp.]|uniref:c-type cytochrome n=1 Tax=Thiohalorhabdus sp. TaxID=3094134 RepID=UPI002FC2E821